MYRNLYILYIRLLIPITSRSHKITFDPTITLIFNRTNKFPTMSNLEDTDSASSYDTFMEVAHIKREEMPNVTKEHLQILCQGHVDETLINWAMENSQRKCNFIQAVKYAMTHNNLWLCSEHTFWQELARHPPSEETYGRPESLFIMNSVGDQHEDNEFEVLVIQKCNNDDATLQIVKRIVLFGNCPTCYKMMPVGLTCPKCNGEVAQRLHCTKETIELIFREKTNDKRVQAILEHPSDCPQVNALRLSKIGRRDSLC